MERMKQWMYIFAAVYFITVSSSIGQSDDGLNVAKDAIPCDTDINCTIPNSECHLNLCRCQAGYTSRGGNSSVCWQAEFTDRCDHRAQCPLTAGSACVNGICDCMPGWVLVNRGAGLECARILSQIVCDVDETCSQHDIYSQCENSSNVTSENRRTCKCWRGFFVSEEGTTCVPRLLGTGCRSDKECQEGVPNSECVNNVCRCRQDVSAGPGRYFSSRDREECELRVLNAGPCTNNQECLDKVAHSFCDNGSSPRKFGSRRNYSATSVADLSNSGEISRSRCRCEIGFSQKKNKCVEKRIGDMCFSNEDCSKADINSYCKYLGINHRRVTHACQCKQGYILKAENISVSGNSTENQQIARSKCQKRKLGTVCRFNEECSAAVEFSVCTPCSARLRTYDVCNDTCDTIDGATDSVRCSKTKVCDCLEGYTSDKEGSPCVKVSIYGKCSSDRDCRAISGPVICVAVGNDDQCRCPVGFRSTRFDNGQEACVKKLLGDHCYEDDDCRAVQNSACRSGVCSCTDGHVNNIYGVETSMTCRRRLIGESCNKTVNCSPGIVCMNKVCRCPVGWAANSNLHTCEKLTLGKNCESDIHCATAVRNSTCDSKKRECVCKEGYFNSTNMCERMKIGDLCKFHDGLCPFDHSECDENGYCACIPGYLASDNFTCSLRRLDDTCERLTDCSVAVPNSECEASRCQCQSGFMAAGNSTQCTKRKLQDPCNYTRDCSKIAYSICVDKLCQCDEKSDHRPLQSDCVLKPTSLIGRCYLDKQCKELDSNSSCHYNTCVCPDDMFMDLTNMMCLPLPTTVGQACRTDYTCQRTIKDSICDTTSGGQCMCRPGHFASSDGQCPHEPRKLGDYCEETNACIEGLNSSVTMCNATRCVCRYGYKTNSSGTCTERELIPQYEPVEPDLPVPCEGGVCKAWTNSTCVPRGADSQHKFCACKPKTARHVGSSECEAVQTYKLSLKIMEIADRYDYKPLELGLKAQEIKELSDRITLGGVNKLFENSSLATRFVSSEVQQINRARVRHRRSVGLTHSGVNVKVLVHLTADYLNAERAEKIFRTIRRQLEWSEGEIHKSKLRVGRPFDKYVSISDFNECKTAGATDCSPHANCVNTLGSYMCVCKPDYVDVEDSLDYTLRGKNCTLAEKGEDACVNGCDTNIDIVIVVLVLFVLTIMVFIVYEIFQRKKTFNARALYAKFGTTKIRKLKKASMRRIKERKKRMKEEHKKRREEHKIKKEAMKKAGTAQKVEKGEEKKKKAEEKRQRKQELAEQRKAKENMKKESKSKKTKFGVSEDQASPVVDNPPVAEESCIDIPDERLETREVTPARPAAFALCDNTYPIAFPDPAMLQDRKLRESYESPV